MYFVLRLSLCIVLFRPAESFEPFSMTAVGLGLAGTAVYFKNQTYCRFYECCDDRSIPGNVEALRHTLQSTLIGQHIVAKHVVPALMAHFSSQRMSRKPLVISFHGQPGTGKNFVADQIAQALYLEGSRSGYVAKYLGQADFPREERLGEYKERVSQEVRKHLNNCPRSLFIFDEVDKMPSGVFDTLASLVDYNAFTDGTDNTKAIFIFISNTGGVHIADHLGQLMSDGNLREDTRLSDFEPILKKAAYTMHGGLKNTALIDSHVIDHFIPFLPMEKSHVIMYMEAEFRRWKKTPDKSIIDDILKNSVRFDSKHGLFAISGCKTLEKKVAMAIYAN